MMTASEHTITPADAGCWIEGSRGWRGIPYLIDIALSFGMSFDIDDRAILTAYEDNAEEVTLSTGETIDPTECVLGQGNIADRVEEWLNEHVAPDGYVFGWHDGEFFLWSNEQWNDESL